MPRREEALAAMRDALQLMDAEWDITPGTAEYKILEAVAQQIENITYNSVLNDYHFDVDKKTGLELDLFMSLFGFARIKAKRATGSITFARGSVAAQDYVIPLGTQVFVPATDYSPSLFFQTTISAVLASGSTEVSVPAQAVVAGTTGNVASGRITGMSSSVGGITAIINPQAFSGGRDAETDTDLKDRWRRSAFRNISGTEDQFLAVAFNESAYVTRANLVGPIERYSEQIQLSAPYDLTTSSPWKATLSGAHNNSTTTINLTAGHGDRFSVATLGDPDTWFYVGTFTGGAFTEIMKVTNRAANSNTLTVVRAANAPSHSGGIEVRQVFPSSVPDSKYTFAPGGEIVGLNTGLTTQQHGRSGETGDYVLITFDGTFGVGSSTPIPSGSSLPFIYVTTVGATVFGLNSVIELEHEYTPISSRNNFSGAGNKTADKVDIFVDGEDPLTVIEQFPMPVYNDVRFGSDITIAEYLRDDGVNQPQVDNIYTQLSKAPISALPSSISVAATNTQAAITYYKDEDYWLVSNFDDSAGLEGSPRASNGIEWRSPAVAPADAFSITAQNVAGKLAGWYSYAFTYEVDGVETLIGTDGPEAASAINTKANWGKNALVLPVAGGGGSVKWRKVYRTESHTTEADALAATHYLLTVIKNNSSTAFLDNKPDSALLPISPPKPPPEAGTLVTVEYNYNRLIERLDAQMDQVRLVGMDVLTHKADDVKLRFNLAVVLFSGMSTTDVEADLNTILTSWINRKSFRNNIQIADVIEEVGQASGVDNVRLARAGEERNEVQKVAVTTTRTVPDADLDTFTITINGVSTGAISYNEDAGTVREILEAMPNIHEGNTYATLTQEALDLVETDITITDNAGFPKSGLGAYTFPYYIQIDNEIMEVTSNAGDQNESGTATLNVVRGALGSTVATHLTTADLHILGDVAVTKEVSGLTTTYTINFLPNAYSGVNDWGSRRLDLVTAAKYNDASKVTTAVTRKVQGSGSGIQVVADNDMTIIDTLYDDFYLDSDELPSIAGVNLIVRASNTF